MSSLPTWSLHVCNIFLFVFHAGLMLFNMVGWAWPQTRRLHFLCIAATLFSWVVMGTYYGFGYCLCTDWHFQIRRSLGLPVFGQTFLQLMSRVFIGIDMSRTVSNLLTGGGLLLIVVAMIAVQARQKWHHRQPVA